jgi:hypothetical protein
MRLYGDEEWDVGREVKRKTELRNEALRRQGM